MKTIWKNKGSTVVLFAAAEMLEDGPTCGLMTSRDGTGIPPAVNSVTAYLGNNTSMPVGICQAAMKFALKSRKAVIGVTT